MKPCRSSVLAIALACLALTACAGPRSLAPAEASPLARGSAPRQPLPDDMERAAGRLAALVLADLPDTAAAVLSAIQEHDSELQAEGQEPTGLADNALDLVNAMDGRKRYAARAQEMLERDDIDPVLRRRLERYLESRPLEVAEERLSADRWRKVATVFNQLVGPVTKLAMRGGIPTFTTGQAALGSLLAVRSFPEATTEERQALRAYQEFIERHPAAPESEWVAEEIERYDRELREQLHEEALKLADKSLRLHQPRAAIAHLDRADRLIPNDLWAQELREKAQTMRRKRDRNTRRSFQARAFVGVPLDAESRVELEQLSVAVIDGDAELVSRHATAWDDRHPNGPLWDEMRFLQAYWYLAHEDEDQFFRDMKRIGGLSPRNSTMARHARWIVQDPQQNPYAWYRKALSADRRHRVSWVMLGRYARGPTKRDLPRPIEWLLDTPGLAQSLFTFPLRLLQYPTSRGQFGNPVIHAGERYVSRFPTGKHAIEIHAKLEKLYALREHWTQALKHHKALEKPDPEQIEEYREKIAERTLEAAAHHGRVDVRAAIYRSVIKEYGDTKQGDEARQLLKDLVLSASPQQIRLSKEFLLEHPQLAGPSGLGLKRELLDGDDDNGEMHEDGITLLGRTVVRVHLEDNDPVDKAVSEERFRRFIAALEEVSYRTLVTDERERPEPDPQRDLFFERARLGLLDDADTRPSARSEAVFLSSKEKHSAFRRTESILPVEIVLQGGLEDFGLAAFPRLKNPRARGDEFLYR